MNDRQPEIAKTVLIEQTAKKYKAIRAVGIAMLLLSAIIAVVSADEFGSGEGWATIMATGFCVVGFITFGVGVAISWWHHG